MSEAERRRSYVESRVLISSDAILNTTFDDGDLYFTGEQIELMRNLMQYANRIESYASEYEPGYYLTPDDTDWDAIQAIVADLEETLMGNPNTLWGYADRVGVQTIVDGAPADTNQVNLPVVSAGHVHRIGAITLFNTTTVNYTIVLGIVQGSILHYLAQFSNPPAAIPQHWTGDITLKYGDYIQATFYGCTLGDDLYLQANGYEMNVP